MNSTVEEEEIIDEDVIEVDGDDDDVIEVEEESGEPAAKRPNVQYGEEDEDEYYDDYVRESD